MKLNSIYKENKYTRNDKRFIDLAVDSEFGNFSHLLVIRGLAYTKLLMKQTKHDRFEQEFPSSSACGHKAKILLSITT